MEREKRDEMRRGRKTLQNKGEPLREMGMEKTMILESLTNEYSQMDYVCRRLKKNGNLYETWFFNGRLFIKFADKAPKIQISHMEDIYENLDASYIKPMLVRTR